MQTPPKTIKLPDGSLVQAERKVRAGRNPTEAAQMLWNSMRVMRRFTASELEVVTECNANTAYSYCYHLAALGWLKVAGVQVSGMARRNVYTLVLNTGPQAPRYNARCRTGFDPNTGLTHWPDGRRERVDSLSKRLRATGGAALGRAIGVQR